MALDVDGTLIGTSPNATDLVVEAVRAAHDAGLAVGFATGREGAGVEDLQAQLGFAGPHVLHNGGELWAGGEVLHRWPLPTRYANALLDLARARGLYVEFYLGDGFLVTDRRPEASAHWRLLRREPDGLVAEHDLASVEVLKATVVLFGNEDSEAVLAALGGIGATVGVGWAPPTPGLTYVNLTHPEADKGRALAVAAEYLGVGLDQTVVVGDGLNDLSMLAVAGTAVAMGQAPLEVQALAHLVTAEVDADGAAHALHAAAAWRASAVEA